LKMKYGVFKLSIGLLYLLMKKIVFEKEKGFISIESNAFVIQRSLIELFIVMHGGQIGIILFPPSVTAYFSHVILNMTEIVRPNIILVGSSLLCSSRRMFGLLFSHSLESNS